MTCPLSLALSPTSLVPDQFSRLFAKRDHARIGEPDEHEPVADRHAHAQALPCRSEGRPEIARFSRPSWRQARIPTAVP